MQIRLANTRGFCAGVDRAIEIVRKVLEQKGSPVYVKHEVVHNKTVVNELKLLRKILQYSLSYMDYSAWISTWIISTWISTWMAVPR